MVETANEIAEWGLPLMKKKCLDGDLTFMEQGKNDFPVPFCYQYTVTSEGSDFSGTTWLVVDNYGHWVSYSRFLETFF